MLAADGRPGPAPYTGSVTVRPLTDDRTWFSSLPTMVGSAAALITEGDGAGGRVLLVKPNYRTLWSLPGGILESGEAPHYGCAREVAEELGLTPRIGPLLVVDWTPPGGARAKPIVSFVFDGGTLADGDSIALQAEELDEWRFVGPDAAADYLPQFLVARVAAAFRARATGTPVYLPAAG